MTNDNDVLPEFKNAGIGGSKVQTNQHELVTDGGEKIGVKAPSIDEVAADRLPDTTAEQCAYESCDSQADFMVLLRQTGGATKTFATCDDCQQRACLHLVDNEIVQNDISEWRRELRNDTDEELLTDGGKQETQTTSNPDMHRISLDRSGGVSVVIHATSDDSAHEIEQFVKEDLYDQFHRVYRVRDHNAHLNEEEAGFTDCYQVVVETAEDAARDIARRVTEQFSSEVADD